MKLYLNFFVIICAILNISANIPVTIYYEALCPDSVRFITRQLYPTYQHFKQFLTIEFVPYGKALHTFDSITGKYLFECQHGPEECKANKFQACALSEINNTDIRLNFITCVMSARNPANIYFIEQCSNRFNVNYEKILKCSVSNEGDKLLAFHGNKTWSLEPNVSQIPTVIFNNSLEINYLDQDKSMVHFKELVCGKIEGEKPKICDPSGFFQKIKNFFL